MVANPSYLHLTEADYLAGELISEIKHEYINGDVYAMAGVSRNHERLAGNLYSAFLVQLKNMPCEPFASDLKIKANHNFFYPDVSVVCEKLNGDDYYTEKPIIIIEVLSKSTRQKDKTVKLTNYKTLASLQEYVLIEQDFVEITVHRRENNWSGDYYYLGDDIYFKSIDLTLSVLDIYARVDNEELRDYDPQRAESNML